MNANAEILLLQEDGSFILQVRDDKPGITNPGLWSTFGGKIESGEEPIDAAVRELSEETNLTLRKADLQFYRKCIKTKEEHGEDWEVYYFFAKPVSTEGLEVYEGQGYTILSGPEMLKHAKVTTLLGQVLADYYEGFRSYLFQDDMPDSAYEGMLTSQYEQLSSGKSHSSLKTPVAVTCTGLVASGKSTITAPLAQMVDAVTISSDLVREEFFQAGYNFKQIRPFVRDLLKRAVSDGYNVFLDLNAANSLPLLDYLSESGYRIVVMHANPPETYIKQKVLSGNMKHELSFFQKDEYVYDSMMTWRDNHLSALPLLQQKYGIWREIDTSRDDLPELIRTAKKDFAMLLGIS